LVEGRKGGLEFFLPPAGRGSFVSSLSPECNEGKTKELALRLGAIKSQSTYFAQALPAYSFFLFSQKERTKEKLCYFDRLNEKPTLFAAV